MDKLFENYTYGKVALQKMAPVPENFFLTCAGFVGTSSDCMKVEGAVFREAIKGPRKGELCIMVPYTGRVAHVTRAEIEAYEAQENKND